MKFSFHPRAEEEFEAAILYYEDCKPGLGMELAEELYAAIQRISEYPDAWPVMSPHTRRCLLCHFLYGVIYQITSGTLRIIAVANLHRQPDYWRDRC